MKTVLIDKIIAVSAIILSTLTLVYAADLPDPKLTPGVAEPKLTQDRICAPGFSTKPWRHVSSGDKAAVYRSYGMKKWQGTCATAKGCEIDHLIPLELGGSNSHKNLWPQPFQGQVWNAYVKDDLENQLHTMVCSGELNLQEAQMMIKTDWVSTWKLVFGKEMP